MADCDEQRSSGQGAPTNHQFLSYIRWYVRYGENTGTHLTSLSSNVAKHLKNIPEEVTKIIKRRKNYDPIDDIEYFENSFLKLLSRHSDFVTSDISEMINDILDMIKRSKDRRKFVSSLIDEHFTVIEGEFNAIQTLFERNDSVLIISRLTKGIKDAADGKPFNTEAQRIPEIVGLLQEMKRTAEGLKTQSSYRLVYLYWRNKLFNGMHNDIANDIYKHDFTTVIHELSEITLNSVSNTDPANMSTLGTLFSAMEKRARIINKKTKKLLSKFGNIRINLRAARYNMTKSWMAHLLDLITETENVLNQYYVTSQAHVPAENFYFDPLQQPYGYTPDQYGQQAPENTLYDPLQQPYGYTLYDP